MAVSTFTTLDSNSVAQTLQTLAEPFVASATVTMPSSAAAHATGSMILASTPAALQFTVARVNAGLFVIERARIKIQTDANFVGVPLYLKLYAASPTIETGDSPPR